MWRFSFDHHRFSAPQRQSRHGRRRPGFPRQHRHERQRQKVRRLYHGGLAGFAGATADAFTLFERFEGQLEKHRGHLVRAAVELAKDWRTDRS